MTALMLHLALIHLLMAMIPGPNTLAVTYCATMVSRRAGLMAAAGVAAASFVWLALSLLGIGALLASAETCIDCSGSRARPTSSMSDAR